MSLRETVTNATETAANKVRDPEVQRLLKVQGMAVGSMAVEGALGDEGLKILKVGKDGERKIKKIRAARVAFRALRNPVGVFRKAGKGVYREAREQQSVAELTLHDQCLVIVHTI